MATRAGVRFRAHDIWDCPEDGNRYEVVGGELLVTPPPSEPHQRAVIALSSIIWQFVRGRRMGRVYQAPFGVMLSPDTAVQPDILYISNTRESIISGRGAEGAPDLVVEVLSPGTSARDRGIKMRQYATAGVAHYWLIDPLAHTLEAYELVEKGYALTENRSGSEIFCPTLFHGLEIPLADLWA